MSSSTPYISNLSEILRRANEHYAQVAVDVRSSLRPTHHAWKRARRLGLRVNVLIACNLEASAVSQIPPAVLENTPPPAASCLYPLPGCKVVGREREIRNSLLLRRDSHQGVRRDNYSSASSSASSSDSRTSSRKVYCVWKNSSSSSSSSSSSASSCGPITPPDYEDRNMSIGGCKRKSLDDEYHVEKRPRYERKDFVRQHNQQVVSRVPASRRY